ncbi:MAG: HAMP domain-containing histidine kinase [Frankia sp.]|nr:HAMP domain-containing histidine kinase [Frankia sp.]
MTRRILALQLALIALLLVVVALPLGMDAARHDRALFVLRMTSATDAYSMEVRGRIHAGEEDPLPDPITDDQPGATEHDDLALYSVEGALLATAGRPIPVSQQDLALAREEQVVHQPSEATGRHMIIVTPVRNAYGLVAILAVSRSDEHVQAEIRERWIRLGLGFGVSSLVALALSWLLARWVGRPLRRLERAAAAFGSGDLGTRAERVGGPAEVRQLAASFDGMANRIEWLVGSQRAFLADVSHQLRTPLTAMRLRLELLAQDVSPTVAGEVGGTLAEVHRLSRMVDGLLAMARAQGAPQPRRPVRLAQVAADRVAMWRPVADTAGVTLQHKVDPALTALLTPGHLEQVLDNLLANALAATPAGGHVRIEATQPGLAGPAGPPGEDPMIQMTVTDTGPGMSAPARARAFQRFRASGGTAGADTAGTGPGGTGDGPGQHPRGERADQRGNGLGLAIVHALVTADGGEVTLGVAPSGGLLVRLDLPPVPPEAEESTAGRTAASAAPAAGQAR